MAYATSTFSHADLLALLPRLRSYARALAHDRDQADELVQGTVVQALSHQTSFTPGTSLSGWMFRILRNLFLDGKRRYRPTQEIDNDIEQSHSVPATQERDLMKGEFLRAFDKLHPVQREALVLAGVEGMEYHEIAKLTGVALGTVKSRVCRARDELAKLMLDEEPTKGANVRRAPSDVRRRRYTTPTPALST